MSKEGAENRIKKMEKHIAENPNADHTERRKWIENEKAYLKQLGKPEVDKNKKS